MIEGDFTALEAKPRINSEGDIRLQEGERRIRKGSRNGDVWRRNWHHSRGGELAKRAASIREWNEEVSLSRQPRKRRNGIMTQRRAPERALLMPRFKSPLLLTFRGYKCADNISIFRSPPFFSLPFSATMAA